MVSITLSIPEEIRKKMKQYDEINWSALVRKIIEKKIQELSWKEEMLKQLKKEEEFTNWTVEIGKKAKRGRFKRLLEELTPQERKELINNGNNN